MTKIKTTHEEELMKDVTENTTDGRTTERKDVILEAIASVTEGINNDEPKLDEIEKQLMEGMDADIETVPEDISGEIMDFEAEEDLGSFNPVEIEEPVEDVIAEEEPVAEIMIEKEPVEKVQKKKTSTKKRTSPITPKAKNITEAIGMPAGTSGRTSFTSIGKNLIPKKKDKRNIHNFILDNSHLDRKSSEEEKIRQELASSLDPNMQIILTGVVEGSRIHYLRNDRAEPTLFALVKYKNKFVEIKAEDILGIKDIEAKKEAIWKNSAKSKELTANKTIDDREIIEAKNKAYVRALSHMIDKRYGSEVDFIVIYIDPTNYDYIVGNRHMAMEKKINRYWKEKEHAVSRQKGGGTTIKEGNIAEARIVTVIKTGIFVEVFGIESFIPNKELSYVNIADARTVFTVGNNIRVLVMRIDMDEDKNITFECSYKKSMPNPLKKSFELFQEGDIVTGTVTKITSKTAGEIGQIRFFVNVNNQVDIYCNLMPGISQIPLVGDTVSLIINGIDTDALRMWGCINRNQSYHNR